ncbi:unnamed protein product [Amoebophrya sp. A120]|nr:unnamed protein product [Amoebophrya sp. A120]|eukprot:GSA120T00006190001.1
MEDIESGRVSDEDTTTSPRTSARNTHLYHQNEFYFTREPTIATLAATIMLLYFNHYRVDQLATWFFLSSSTFLFYVFTKVSEGTQIFKIPTSPSPPSNVGGAQVGGGAHVHAANPARTTSGGSTSLHTPPPGAVPSGVVINSASKNRQRSKTFVGFVLLFLLLVAGVANSRFSLIGLHVADIGSLGGPGGPADSRTWLSNAAHTLLLGEQAALPGADHAASSTSFGSGAVVAHHLPTVKALASSGATNDQRFRRKKQTASVQQQVSDEFRGLSVSIIIPAKYEKEYIVRTLMYVYQITPFALLEEVIVVDDQSDDSLVDDLVEKAVVSPTGELNFLTDEQRRSIKVMRNDHRQGLIRAKIMGANAAVGSHIFFLDGHCRPFEGWLEPLLRRSLGNYKRIVVPTIPDVEAKDWSKKSNVGIKMMFEWNFHFDWFDDPGDEVPILSGGLLLMTKKWWNEMGGYDDGMLEWGGENIEQSLRCWMCGGEIVVERHSQVGHIFFRPQPPNKVKPLTVPRNKARGAYVWLDNYYQVFADRMPDVKNKLDLGSNLLERMLFRFNYGCEKFQWWLRRFESVFETQGLIVDKQHHLRHTATGYCMEGTDKGKIVFDVCSPEKDTQKWGFINQRKRLVNAKFKRCVDRGNNPGAVTPILYNCDRVLSNRNQIWQFTNHHDPPSQKDRNFHDDKAFAGRLYSNNDLDSATFNYGKCLGVGMNSMVEKKVDDVDSSKSNKAGAGSPPILNMFNCGQSLDDDLKKFQFDVIW